MSEQAPVGVGPELFRLTGEGPVLHRAFPAEAKVHAVLDDLPLGVYTNLVTYGHERFVGLDAHLARLEQSARLARLKWPAESGGLRSALAQLARSSPHADSMLRIDVLEAPLEGEARMTITRGPALPVPARYLELGVGVGIARGLSRSQPRVKSARFPILRRPYPLGTHEAYEHLLLDDQERVLEGTSSNVFAVQDGVLVTAPDGVLEGVTRRLVLALARGRGIETRLERLPLARFGTVSEAFLTSSTRGLVPVVRVEEGTLGGAPGPVTRALMSDYAELVARASSP